MSQHLRIRDLEAKLSESQKQLGHYKIECEQMKKQMALSEFLVESNDLRKTINKLVKENEQLEAQVKDLNHTLRDVIKQKDRFAAQLDLYSDIIRNKTTNLPGGTQV